MGIKFPPRFLSIPTSPFTILSPFYKRGRIKIGAKFTLTSEVLTEEAFDQVVQGHKLLERGIKMTKKENCLGTVKLFLISGK